jgi:hypothetical protein
LNVPFTAKDSSMPGNGAMACGHRNMEVDSPQDRINRKSISFVSGLKAFNRRIFGTISLNVFDRSDEGFSEQRST